MNNERKMNNQGKGSIGFFGLLTIVFIVLKLCGVISWSWLWVLAPFWIPESIVLILFIITLVLRAIIKHKRKSEEKKRG